MKTYIIDYTVYFSTWQPFSKKIKVKNCMGELHAKVKLEAHLKTKYPSFARLIVHSCKESNMITDLFDTFGKN